METVWFVLVAMMLVAYVIFDGFTLGIGIIDLVAARGDDQKRKIQAVVAPVWDPNEVWLIATAGTLYFAFPALYSSSFSGFYLPLIIVLWFLIMRALGIELRHWVETRLWSTFFTFLFGTASLVLAFVLGVALGNVIRGVPLDGSGYFFEPLWTNFLVHPTQGIIDWYTTLIGGISLVTLTGHGANYLAHRSEGELESRARLVAAGSWIAMVILTVVGFFATIEVRPAMLDNYYASGGYAAAFPALVGAGLAAMAWFLRTREYRRAFLSSSVYIAGMLGGVAFGLYPYVLPAVPNPDNGLTIYNTAAGAYGLRVGIVWWSIGMALVIVYFTFLYRSRGVKAGASGSQDLRKDDSFS